jgi:vacuolar-type H+-ATPase subunit I/STV1
MSNAAGHLLPALLPALLLAASFASTIGAVEPPASQDPVGAPTTERAVVADSLQAARQLLTTLDQLETNLAGVAQRALDQADAATTLDARRRYERLYSETSIRLGELKATRADLQRQIDYLEPQPEPPADER